MQSQRRQRHTRGVSAIEYGIVAVLVATTAIIGYRGLGKRVRCAMVSAGSRFSGDDVPAECQPPTAVAANSGSSDGCQGAACLLPGRCFVAGTLVLTAEGEQPIETITVGEEVLARDEGGQLAWQPVTRTFARSTDALVRLTLAGGDDALELTPEHRLFVDGRGWVEARTLAPGDALLDPSGAAVVVSTVESLAVDTRVFNLEVAELHSYFVGQRQIWAHNECGDDGSGGGGPRSSTSSNGSTGGGGPASGSDNAPPATSGGDDVPTIAPAPSRPGPPNLITPTTATVEGSSDGARRTAVANGKGIGSMALYADAPTQGILGGTLPSYQDLQERQVGHAFIGLDDGKGNGPKYYGMYPKDYFPRNPLETVPGEIIKDDTSHLGRPTTRQTFPYVLTKPEVSAVKKYIRDNKNTPYNLLGRDGGKNCASFACGAVEAAGRRPPNSFGVGLFPNPHALHSHLPPNPYEGQTGHGDDSDSGDERYDGYDE